MISKRALFKIAKHPKVQLYDPDNGMFIVTEEFRVTVAGKEIVVPIGFKTDLGSVPSWLWWFRAPWHNLTAVVVHDYLLHLGWARKDADLELFELVEGRFDKWLYYGGVRVWAWVKAI